MKKLWDYVAVNLSRESQVIEVADRVVERVFDKAWSLLVGRILDLPVAEARGYVQARAAILLRDAVIAECSSSHDPAVYSCAMAMTVQRAIDRAHYLRARTLSQRAA